MNEQLTDGITQEQIFKNLRSAGRDDLLKNFERNTGQEINPADLGGQEIPQLNTRNQSETRMQTSETDVFNFQNNLKTEQRTLLEKARFGDVTQQDLINLEAMQTQRALDILEGKEGRAEERKKLSEELDIEGQMKSIQQYQNQLEAEQRSLETAKRRLQENPEGLGSGALQGRINQLERQSLQKQADIAILGNAARGELNTTQTIIQHRLDLEFGDIEEQWDNFQTQVQAVSGLTSTVRTQLQEQAQEEKDRISQVRQTKEAMYRLAVDIAQSNPELARQIYSQSNLISENTTLTEAQQQLDSVRSIAIESGVFTNTTGGNDFNSIAEMVNTNPELYNMSGTQLKNYLLGNTNLNVTEINSIIDNKPMSEFEIFDSSIGYVESAWNKKLFKTRKGGELTAARENAKKLIDQDVKQGFLSKEEAERMKQHVADVEFNDVEPKNLGKSLNEIFK